MHGKFKEEREKKEHKRQIWAMISLVFGFILNKLTHFAPDCLSAHSFFLTAWPQTTR